MKIAIHNELRSFARRLEADSSIRIDKLPNIVFDMLKHVSTESLNLKVDKCSSTDDLEEVHSVGMPGSEALRGPDNSVDNISDTPTTRAIHTQADVDSLSEREEVNDEVEKFEGPYMVKRLRVPYYVLSKTLLTPLIKRDCGIVINYEQSLLASKTIFIVCLRAETRKAVADVNQIADLIIKQNRKVSFDFN